MFVDRAIIDNQYFEGKFKGFISQIPFNCILYQINNFTIIILLANSLGAKASFLRALMESDSPENLKGL